MSRHSPYENMGTIDGFDVTYNRVDQTYTIVDAQGDSEIDITVDYDTIARLGLLMHELDRDATRRAFT